MTKAFDEDQSDARKERDKMITRIKTQAVYVTDQDKALRFYSEALGFELRRDQAMGPGGRWLEVAPPGAQSCVVLYPRSMMKEWDRKQPSIIFACEDVHQTHQRLIARGVEFTQPPQEMPWGTFATFRDPDANEFVLSDAP
jgi:predicted enzyme related to lactoylglutathione lyase